MTFSLGRVGLAAASGGDGLTMAEPLEWDQSGETITLRGIQDARTLAANNYETNLLWWRDQMLGLAHENGEDAIPVRSTTVTGFDGYYRVVDVGVNHPEGSLNSGTLYATWAVALQREPSWRQPRHELVGAFGQLSNTYGLTGTLVTAAPPGVFDWELGGDLVTIFTGGTSYLTRSADGGAGSAVTMNVGADTTPGNSGQWTGRYLGVIGNHYLGACRVEYDAANNGTYRQVVGYRVFDTSAAAALMRVSNGMVRVTVSTSDLQVSHWDGTQWDTAVPVNIVYVGTTTALSFLRAAVLKNTPTTVGIRFYCQLVTGSTLSDGLFEVDLTLRRGSRAVFLHVTRNTGAVGQWRLQFASATASTAVNSGAIRQTSNNSGGNRVILAAQDASTQDLVNGRITQASAKSALFAAVTAEIGGSGAGGSDVASAQALETFVLASETQRTVGY